MVSIKLVFIVFVKFNMVRRSLLITILLLRFVQPADFYLFKAIKKVSAIYLSNENIFCIHLIVEQGGV